MHPTSATAAAADRPGPSGEPPLFATDWGDKIVALKARAPWGVFPLEGGGLDGANGFLLAAEAPSSDLPPAWRVTPPRPALPGPSVSAHELLEAQSWVVDMTEALLAAVSACPPDLAVALGLCLSIGMRRNGSGSAPVKLLCTDRVFEANRRQIAARNLSSRLAEAARLASLPEVATLLLSPRKGGWWTVALGTNDRFGSGKPMGSARVRGGTAEEAAAWALAAHGVISRLDGEPAPLHRVRPLSATRNFGEGEATRIRAALGPAWPAAHGDNDA